MRLIETTFGLDLNDPLVPPAEFLGSRDEEGSDRTYVGWCSAIATANDEAVNGLNFPMREETTMEQTRFACSMSSQWSFSVSAGDTLVVMMVEVGGPKGWHEKLQPTASQRLAARALEILTTGWAVWHATGYAHDYDHHMGILWLTAAGFEWDEAISVSAADSRRSGKPNRRRLAQQMIAATSLRSF